MKILLCEDDENLGMLLREYLQAKGFMAELCPDGEVGYKAFLKSKFDICVLDVMMPKKDGFTLAQEIRQANAEIPIIFLTAKQLKEDILEGFKIGADDYITKPFSFDTVLARIKAVLKRTHPAPPPSTPHVFSFGTLKVDMDNTHVSIQGKNIELTRREYLILCLLIQHPNYHFTREEIMVQVWPNDTLVNDRSVDVHITRLRKKLGPESWRLINRTGFGYAFVNNDSKIAE